MTNREQCIEWYRNANKLNPYEASTVVSNYPGRILIHGRHLDIYRLMFNPEYKFFESMPWKSWNAPVFDRMATIEPDPKEEIKECAGKTAEEIFQYIVDNCKGET